MTPNVLSRIFTIEIGDRPTLTFEAQNQREAQELCHEQWLKDDLAEAKSDGAPLWDGKATLRARMAAPDESAVFAEAKNSGQSSDGLMLVYLVELDGSETDEQPIDPGAFPPGRDSEAEGEEMSAPGPAWTPEDEGLLRSMGAAGEKRRRDCGSAEALPPRGAQAGSRTQHHVGPFAARAEDEVEITTCRAVPGETIIAVLSVHLCTQKSGMISYCRYCGGKGTSGWQRDAETPRTTSDGRSTTCCGYHSARRTSLPPKPWIRIFSDCSHGWPPGVA